MIKNLYRARCNGCGTDTNPFGGKAGLQNYLDNIAGWKTTKVGARWVHFCPKCRQELGR